MTNNQLKSPNITWYNLTLPDGDPSIIKSGPWIFIRQALSSLVFMLFFQPTWKAFISLAFAQAYLLYVNYIILFREVEMPLFTVGLKVKCWQSVLTVLIIVVQMVRCNTQVYTYVMQFFRHIWCDWCIWDVLSDMANDAYPCLHDTWPHIASWCTRNI